MNIFFKKIRYKNLLSTGNVFTEIDLASKKSTLISGKNGSGKSTILDALTFALYGKPLRKINKPQLINSVNNKELLIEIEFTVNQADYLVRRGLKPAVFEIFKNGILLNQDAAVRDYQEVLEKNILKMNIKSFSQIVILGSATYIPFMELPAAGRREVIEDLLDIQIFSTMNTLLKEKISNNKTELSDNNYAIELQKTKIDSANNHNKEIMSIRLVEVDKIKERVKHHLERIQEHTDVITAASAEIDEKITLIADKKSVRDKINTFTELKLDLSSKLRQFQTNLDFYHDHDNCPTCKQGIDHEFKSKIVTESSQKQSELSAAREALDGKLDKLKTRLDEISNVEDEITKLNTTISEQRSFISSSKNALQGYKKDLSDAEKEVEAISTANIQDLEQELKVFQDKQEALTESRETLAVAATMLKDSGIKTKIIQQYIPIINGLINKYLSAFELFVDFNLDETFTEVIKSRFRDTFSYASFSEGEKLRINLCILFAWRAVAKMRNSVSTNLLLFDEILDGPMDSGGIESLLTTLYSLNQNDNIFIISHRGDGYGDKFEQHLQFQKTKNFSHMAIASE